MAPLQPGNAVDAGPLELRVVEHLGRTQERSL
jgi:hypothetical protein